VDDKGREIVTRTEVPAPGPDMIAILNAKTEFYASAVGKIQTRDGDFPHHMRIRLENVNNIHEAYEAWDTQVAPKVNAELQKVVERINQEHRRQLIAQGAGRPMQPPG
jgi:hypothetical protein